MKVSNTKLQIGGKRHKNTLKKSVRVRGFECNSNRPLRKTNDDVMKHEALQPKELPALRCKYSDGM